MVKGMQDPHSSHAIHRRVLDSGLRPSGRGRFRGVLGERTRDQESARSEKRRAGEPMVDEAAHVWIAAELVSPLARDSNHENVLEAAQRSGAVGGAPYPADSESADADEPPVSKCFKRRQRGDWPSHRQGDSRWRTQSAEAGCSAGRTRESKRSGDCSQPGGELARRSLVLTKARARRIRILCEANLRM